MGGSASEHSHRHRIRRALATGGITLLPGEPSAEPRRIDS